MTAPTELVIAQKATAGIDKLYRMGSARLWHGHYAGRSSSAALRQYDGEFTLRQFRILKVAIQFDPQHDTVRNAQSINAQP